MSDPGFHEVQLSGKQLVFLFMSAIVLLVVTFLLGVNVGRGVRTAVADTEVQAQAEPSQPNVIDEAAPAGERPQPTSSELSYHDLLLGAASAGETPAPTPTPAAAASEPPAPVSEPVAAQTQAAAPVPMATPPPAASPKASSADWFLQTGAYSTRAVAEGQVAELKKLNVPAFVAAPEPGAAVKFFRVRIGPYADRAEAEQVKSRIARQGYSSSITR